MVKGMQDEHEQEKINNYNVFHSSVMEHRRYAD